LQIYWIGSALPTHAIPQRMRIEQMAMPQSAFGQVVDLHAEACSLLLGDMQSTPLV